MVYIRTDELRLTRIFIGQVQASPAFITTTARACLMRGAAMPIHRTWQNLDVAVDIKDSASMFFKTAYWSAPSIIPRAHPERFRHAVFRHAGLCHRQPGDCG